MLTTLDDTVKKASACERGLDGFSFRLSQRTSITNDDMSRGLTKPLRIARNAPNCIKRVQLLFYTFQENGTILNSERKNPGRVVGLLRGDLTKFDFRKNTL